MTRIRRKRAERPGLVGRLRARLAPAPLPEPCRCRNPYGEVEAAGKEELLDVRDLPLVGQIGWTLARMEEIAPGDRLRQVNTLVAWPLLAMLETRGYRYRVVGRRAGDVHLLIWPLAPR